LHWAEKIADRIIKKNPDKEEYVCAAGISPSGFILFYIQKIPNFALPIKVIMRVLITKH